MSSSGTYPQKMAPYTLFPNEKNQWDEANQWDESIGSLPCLQSKEKLEKKHQIYSVVSPLCKSPICSAISLFCKSPETFLEVKNPPSYKHLNFLKANDAAEPSMTSTSSPNTDFTPVNSICNAPQIPQQVESLVTPNAPPPIPEPRKAVHIKILDLPTVQSITTIPSNSSSNRLVDKLSTKALIESKTAIKASQLEEKKPILKAPDSKNLKEKPFKAVEAVATESVNVIPNQNHQLVIKEICSAVEEKEEKVEETELPFKDIVGSLTINEAKKAIDIFLQSNLKANLEKIGSPIERRKIYAHLIMLCGQAYREKKDPALAKKLLEVHSSLIDQSVIKNEVTFIQLLFLLLEEALDSSDSELKCLGLDMLIAYFSFNPKKIGNEKDLLEKFLLEDPANALETILKKREKLEEVVLQLMPPINYDKIALKMNQAKYALPYLLMWLKKFQKNNCKWGSLDETCFIHLFEFMQDFSKEELNRIFEALCKVNLPIIKQNEKAFNSFQDIVYNYYSRRFSLQTNTIDEQKDIFISFCSNLDKISPRSIFNLKHSLEKLCRSIQASFPAIPVKDEAMDYWAFSEDVFVPAKPLASTLSQTESQQSPSASLAYFTSAINTVIGSPLFTTEVAGETRAKRKTKSASKVIKKPLKDNLNATLVINHIFDQLLLNLPPDDEGRKTVFETVHKWTFEAGKRFNFINSSNQYLLRYIQCYAEDVPDMESIAEYKIDVLDPILDFTEQNRYGWDIYFKLNKEKIPYELIKSCIKVMEKERLRFGLSKEQQDNLLSNLLRISRAVIESDVSNSVKQDLIKSTFHALIYLTEVDDTLKENLEAFFLSSQKIYEGRNFLRLMHLYRLEAFLDKKVINSEKVEVDVKSDEMTALELVFGVFAREENLISTKNGFKLIELHKEDFKDHFDILAHVYQLLFASLDLTEEDSRNLLFTWIRDELLCEGSIFSETGNRNKGLLIQEEEKTMQKEEQKAHRQFMDFFITQYILATKKAIEVNFKKKEGICKDFLHVLKRMAQMQYFDLHSQEDCKFLDQIMRNVNPFLKEYRMAKLCGSCYDEFSASLKEVVKRSNFLHQYKENNPLMQKLISGIL